MIGRGTVQKVIRALFVCLFSVYNTPHGIPTRRFCLACNLEEVYSTAEASTWGNVRLGVSRLPTVRIDATLDGYGCVRGDSPPRITMDALLCPTRHLTVMRILSCQPRGRMRRNTGQLSSNYNRFSAPELYVHDAPSSEMALKITRSASDTGLSDGFPDLRLHSPAEGSTCISQMSPIR